MKLQYKNSKTFNLVAFFVTNLLLISCGSYQSVSNNDGIYDDGFNEEKKEEQKQVVIVEQKAVNNYEKNHFTKELDRLSSVEDEEIFLDIDSYNSENNFNEDEIYHENSPWGYEENDVVVNINLVNDPFWVGNTYAWGFYNPWVYNWGYNPYWNYPYWRNGYWGYNPYWNYRGWNNAYYNNRISYGRRTSNAVTGRRSYSNSRYGVTSRNYNSSNNYITRRGSTYSRRSSSINKNSNTSRRSSNIGNNSSRRKNSSSTSSRNSSNRNYNKSSSRSSSRSYNPSRSSSSRSTGTRSSRSSSSSRRRN
jgi:hypothetical protein